MAPCHRSDEAASVPAYQSPLDGRALRNAPRTQSPGAAVTAVATFPFSAANAVPLPQVPPAHAQADPAASTLGAKTGGCAAVCAADGRRHPLLVRPLGRPRPGNGGLLQLLLARGSPAKQSPQ